MKRMTAFVLSFLVYQHTLAFSQNSLTMASYNFENFWDSVPKNTENEWKQYKLTLPKKEREKLNFTLQYSSYSKERSNWYEKSVLKSKIENVIKVLKVAKTPDIVALQEVESSNNKSSVFDTPYENKATFRTMLAELGYHYIYLGQQEEDNPVSVTTAFISKVKLEIPEQVKIESPGHSSSARDLQVAVLNLANERVVIFNNHWKSKRSGSEEIRVSTARKLLERIKEEQKNQVKTHFVVLGDLNSAYYEKPIQVLGSTENRSNHLYNLWYDLPPEDRWESSFNGVRGTLSHILVSNSLFDESSFHYVDNSFEVIGHKGEAKKLLLSVNGQPFRWQIRFYYTWFQHIERGYSDHLPLVATFNYPKANSIKKKGKQNPTGKKALPPAIYFNEIEPCFEETALDLGKVRYKSAEDLDRKCVKLEIDTQYKPLPLKNRGKYSQSYIHIPLMSRGLHKDTLELGISMVGRYDWRPNVHDKRVSYEKASIPEGIYNDRRWHPKSNKCFIRKILQKKGGSLRKIMGRVGYSDGYLSIHIASREDIILEDLPTSKLDVCPWL